MSTSLVSYLNSVCLICRKLHEGPCSDKDLTELMEGPTSSEAPFPFEGDL